MTIPTQGNIFAINRPVIDIFLIQYILLVTILK